MKILGLDTSSHTNTVGVISDDRVLADFAWDAKSGSLQRILSAVDFILDSTLLRLEDIDGFAVGIGPGSWTGVRVGLTVGKVLAYATRKPLCGVSSLDTLAQYGENAPGQVCPMVDAGRGRIYAALYRARQGVVTRESDHYSGDVDGLLEMIQEPTRFLGEAVSSHREEILGRLGSLALIHSCAEDVHRGSIIALLAADRLMRGESDDALSLVPLYLRESAAQTLLGAKSLPSTEGEN
jgi:tRNA threonylcarbamoyladenosine biosynthesis protein TsaB